MWEDPSHAAEREFLDGLALIAQRIEGTYKKSPMSGKSLVKGMQERYFALVPSQFNGGDVAAGQPKRALQGWILGRLSVWRDKSSFLAKDPPRGSIEIMKIAKVSWDRNCPSGNRVIIKHLAGDKEFQELVVQMATKSEAEEWAYALWDFIARLRDSLDDH